MHKKNSFNITRLQQYKPMLTPNRLLNLLQAEMLERDCKTRLQFRKCPQALVLEKVPVFG
jgi:hypothetical protein